MKSSLNIENFKRLLEIVEKSSRARSPKKRIFMFYQWFDNTGYEYHETVGDVMKHPCGTAGCLAGWATILSLSDAGKTNIKLDDLQDKDFIRIGRTFLGLSYPDAMHLFHGKWATHIKHKEVIEKLKDIITTGKVRRETERH